MKCKYEGSGWAEGRCMGTKEVDPCPGYDKCKQFKPNYTTNADHIRSMTDEELAKWMADIWDCNNCSEHERLGDTPLLRDEQCDQKCEQHCLHWLKQSY